MEWFLWGAVFSKTSKQFRCRCLVIAAIPAVDAKGLQKLQSGHTCSFRRIPRDLKGNTHMGLGSQIVQTSVGRISAIRRIKLLESVTSA